MLRAAELLLRERSLPFVDAAWQAVLLSNIHNMLDAESACDAQKISVFQMRSTEGENACERGLVMRHTSQAIYVVQCQLPALQQEGARATLDGR